MNPGCTKLHGAGAPVGRIRFALWFCAAIALIALCLSARFALAYRLAWQCPIMTLFHIPCPSCGSTRALAALSHLQFSAALAFNPLFVSFLFLGPLAFLLRERFACCARWGWAAFALAVFSNWIYLLLFLPR